MPRPVRTKGVLSDQSSRGSHAPRGAWERDPHRAKGHRRSHSKVQVGTEVPGDRCWSGAEKAQTSGEPWCHESGAPGSGRGRWKRAVVRQYLAGGLLHLVGVTSDQGGQESWPQGEAKQVLRGGTQRGTRDAESQDWEFLTGNGQQHWRAPCLETCMRRSGEGRGKGLLWQYLACGLSYYALSYRDLEEMMRERGLAVDHTTIYRWVQQYAPELEQRCRPHLKTTTDSWRVDETYVKVKGDLDVSVSSGRFAWKHAGVSAE